MNRPKICFARTMRFVMIMIIPVQAQAQQEEQESNTDVAVDIYTNYIWRGSKMSSGPSLQPSVSFTNGGLTLGVWGAFDASGYAEADPYVSYSFPFGLCLGITDYYYPDLELFDVSKSTGSHALEINGGYTTGAFSLSANYIFNEAGGAASAGGDKYFQVSYAFSRLDLWIGAGDGWHTSDGKFNLCNIGLGTSKEIELGEHLTIPVTGQVVLNPQKEQLFIVAGFSF